jgi:aspartate kinase
VFNALADKAISVDMIVQNVSHGTGTPLTDLSFTVDKPDLAKARTAIESLQADIGFQEVTTDENVCTLSIVGVGMRSHSGVAARMFEALANAGINIGMISTSEIKISVLIELAKGEQALRVVHETFLG